MKCHNCQHCFDPIRKANPNEATLRIWCPTWVSADKGPIDVCAQCAEVFQPHKNKNAPTGAFFWGELADQRFNSVEAFIRHNDPTYENAKGMIENGTLLKGDTIRPLANVISIVDGKVWLGTYDLIVRLGDYSEVKANYPALCQ